MYPGCLNIYYPECSHILCLECVIIYYLECVVILCLECVDILHVSCVSHLYPACPACQGVSSCFLVGHICVQLFFFFLSFLEFFSPKKFKSYDGSLLVLKFFFQSN